MICQNPIDPATGVALSGDALRRVVPGASSSRCYNLIPDDSLVCPYCGGPVVSTDEVHEKIRIPWAMLLLLVATVAASNAAWWVCDSEEPGPMALVRCGANIDTLTFGGQYWRLVTSAFLHLNPLHFGNNIVCLAVAGAMLERLVGSWRMVSVYLWSAVFGGVFSCVWNDRLVSVGASDAIFGLGAAVVSVVWVSQGRIPGVSQEAAGRLMKGALAFIGYAFVFSLLPIEDMPVDFAAHVGGFLGGLLVGAVLGLSFRQEEGERKPWLRRLIPVASVMLSVVLSVSWLCVNEAVLMSLDEVTSETKDLVVKTLKERLKEAGSQFVDVTVESLDLCHDGGDSYHGQIVVTCRYDDQIERLERSIIVTCDGERLEYRLGDE